MGFPAHFLKKGYRYYYGIDGTIDYENKVFEENDVIKVDVCDTIITIKRVGNGWEMYLGKELVGYNENPKNTRELTVWANGVLDYWYGFIEKKRNQFAIGCFYAMRKDKEEFCDDIEIMNTTKPLSEREREKFQVKGSCIDDDTIKIEVSGYLLEKTIPYFIFMTRRCLNWAEELKSNFVKKGYNV